MLKARPVLVTLSPPRAAAQDNLTGLRWFVPSASAGPAVCAGYRRSYAGTCQRGRGPAMAPRLRQERTARTRSEWRERRNFGGSLDEGQGISSIGKRVEKRRRFGHDEEGHDHGSAGPVCR